MDTVVTVDHLDRNPVESRPTEVVERKGLGHPDTICDGIAEAISRRLTRYSLDTFDRVLHHNADAVQLVPGRTAPAFGGGEVRSPIYVLLGGRATTAVGGRRIPVDELAVEAARAYVETSFPDLPADAIEFESRMGEASADLRALFAAEGVPRANDTCVAVGYAPRSETDRIVRGLPREIRSRVAAVGEDVKVLGFRTDDALRLTVAAAVVSRHVADLEAYLDVVERVREVAEAYASDRTVRTVHVAVNAADDVGAGSVYLTETGLSAEMGDGGNVGRGNRVNGLITPRRPTSPEATAGKNPVSHVGKLYNLVATTAAERIHRELGADHAEVTLLSQIGAPITEPRAATVGTTARDDHAVRAIVREEIDAVGSLADALVAGELSVF